MNKLIMSKSFKEIARAAPRAIRNFLDAHEASSRKAVFPGMVVVPKGVDGGFSNAGTWKVTVSALGIELHVKKGLTSRHGDFFHALVDDSYSQFIMLRIMQETIGKNPGKYPDIIVPEPYLGFTRKNGAEGFIVTRFIRMRKTYVIDLPPRLEAQATAFINEMNQKFNIIDMHNNLWGTNIGGNRKLVFSDPTFIVRKGQTFPYQ
ncbi:MAG: hypothetical protein NTV88_00410 [Candidatus Micrarchaeota archaeon]|nr:hypothetical protein [Candidatus Micrarchaeota archaeon]